MKWVALLGAVVLLAGCGGQKGLEIGGIVPRLEHVGVKPKSPQPEPPGVLEVKSTVYDVPGGELHVFGFPDEQTAKEAAARIQPDGYTIQNTMGINQAVDWAAPPHWYRLGNQIAVYIGMSSKVTDALEEAAGPQFAGA
jgi:hypothetical protein